MVSKQGNIRFGNDYRTQLDNSHCNFDKIFQIAHSIGNNFRCGWAAGGFTFCSKRSRSLLGEEELPRHYGDRQFYSIHTL